MGVTRLVALGAVGAIVAAPSSFPFRGPYPGSISWADSRHGWAPNHGEWRCERPYSGRGDSRVCATEDAGRHWRQIFVGGNYVFAAVRTSRDAGIVSTGAHGHYQFWTRDNGRHWYGTEVAGGVGGFNDPLPVFVGAGTRLYWSDRSGETVYQVTPWPPPGPAVCTGRWAHSAFSVEDADPAGNVCQGPPVEGAMRSEPVISGRGTIVGLALVPDGVFAVLQRRDTGALTAVVRRDGLNSAHELELPDLPTRPPGYVRRVRIDWPSITVTGLFQAAERHDQSWEVLWRSADGGSTWRRTVAPAWSAGADDPVARSGAAAGAVGDEILLVGGRFHDFAVEGPRGSGLVSRLVQAYRPAEDSWRRLRDFPVAVAYAAGASAGRDLYIVGGFDAAQRPTRRAFVLRGRGWRRLPQLPEPRAAAGAAVLAGKLYVVGGVGRSGLARRTLVLDIRAGRWSTIRGPRPRAYLAVAAAAGRVIALGGRTGGAETSLAVADSWRPDDGRWRRLQPLLSPASDLAAAAVGNLVVAVGGATTEYYVPVGSVAAYDVRTGRWRRLPDLRTARYGLSAAGLARRVYALVGGDGDGPTDKGTLNESLLVGR
jgi:hypothetical protein